MVCRTDRGRAGPRRSMRRRTPLRRLLDRHEQRHQNRPGHTRRGERTLRTPAALPRTLECLGTTALLAGAADGIVLAVDERAVARHPPPAPARAQIRKAPG